MNTDLAYKFIRPDKKLSDFVESFWWLQNPSDGDKEVIILPDGRIDLFFSQSATEPFHATLLGIGTQPEQAIIKAQTLTFAISFNLLATEYVFQDRFSSLLNGGQNLPTDFWGFTANDLNDFAFFCKKASQKIQSLLPIEIDGRKQRLFDFLYATNGSLTVEEFSRKAGWSSRQINRYFNRQYGLSLKAYSSILRFRASFQHIKEGKLFPQQKFADQSHFIREVKKLSGVLPKELNRNQNERFIQFSTLPEKQDYQ